MSVPYSDFQSFLLLTKLTQEKGRLVLTLSQTSYITMGNSLSMAQFPICKMEVTKILVSQALWGCTDNAVMEAKADREISRQMYQHPSLNIKTKKNLNFLSPSLRKQSYFFKYQQVNKKDWWLMRHCV